MYPIGPEAAKEEPAGITENTGAFTGNPKFVKTIDVGEGIRTINDVSMWEQLSLAANMQRWWADNQVSCTITFNPVTEGKHIAAALDYFQYQMKGISFLPKLDYGAYPQMPYEEITEEVYNQKCPEIKNLQVNKMSEESVGEKFCDGDSCVRT